MKSDLFITQVGISLHHWLNYVSAVQRGYVLAENSIIYPISDFLGTVINSEKIILDKEHPDLSGKYIDLRYYVPSSEMDLEQEFGMEFKYARTDYTEKPGEQKRIFNDLIRLKIFVDSQKERKAYFLICGEQLEFLKAFQSIGWSRQMDKNGLPLQRLEIDKMPDLNDVTPVGIYSKWFKFSKKDNKGESEFRLSDRQTVPQHVFDYFESENKNSLPDNITIDQIKKITLRTRYIYSSDIANTKGMSNPMRVAIWEILKD